jgi:hypothetical protein
VLVVFADIEKKGAGPALVVLHFFLNSSSLVVLLPLLPLFGLTKVT